MLVAWYLGKSSPLSMIVDSGFSETGIMGESVSATHQYLIRDVNELVKCEYKTG